MTSIQQPLYVRDGSRFVLYDERAQHVPPIPVPVSIPVELEDVAAVEDVEQDEQQPNVTRLVTHRCAHGHFSRPGGLGRGCKACGRGAPVSARRRS